MSWFVITAQPVNLCECEFQTNFRQFTCPYFRQSKTSIHDNNSDLTITSNALDGCKIGKLALNY